MDVVVRKHQLTQLFKLFQFFHLIMRHDVVKSNVLKTYLFNFLLKVILVKNFKCISKNEQSFRSFNFCMPWLDQWITFCFLSTFIPVQPFLFDPFEFTFPFFSNHFYKAWRTHFIIIVNFFITSRQSILLFWNILNSFIVKSF